jgi:hypothetical protein
METDDVRWSIACLDFANRARTLRLVLTRPAGLALLVPPGEVGILLPDQLGELIGAARHARSVLLRGARTEWPSSALCPEAPNRCG